MDVNITNSSKVPATSVRSPVVPASAPVSESEPTSKKEPVRQAIRTDNVELSKESQVASTAKELIVEHNQNRARGSRAYHDETTNRFVTEVVNSNNEVIRQIPIEDALESARRFKKITGLIFNQEA
jgi:uncharacterized FlaG/YvyC family protein